MTMTIDVHPAGDSEQLGGYRDSKKRNQQRRIRCSSKRGMEHFRAWGEICIKEEGACKIHIRRDFKISCLAGVAGVDFPLYIT